MSAQAPSDMDDNGAGSGQVAIPTPPCLFEIILIPVPFKKLNGMRRAEAGMINFYTCPV